MNDFLFFILCACSGGLVLGLAFLAWELFLFTVYRLTGGKLDLVSYLEKF